MSVQHTGEWLRGRHELFFSTLLIKMAQMEDRAQVPEHKDPHGRDVNFCSAKNGGHLVTPRPTRDTIPQPAEDIGRGDATLSQLPREDLMLKHRYPLAKARAGTPH